jgi:hypothetical protein
MQDSTYSVVVDLAIPDLAILLSLLVLPFADVADQVIDAIEHEISRLDRIGEKDDEYSNEERRHRLLCVGDWISREVSPQGLNLLSEGVTWGDGGWDVDVSVLPMLAPLWGTVAALHAEAEEWERENQAKIDAEFAWMKEQK